jgi:lipopolysaccharide/colanic/teichoic acid biosynthesis glycosyltransferase
MTVETLEASEQITTQDEQPQVGEMQLLEPETFLDAETQSLGHVVPNWLYFHTKYLGDRVIGCVLLTFAAPIIIGLIIAVRRSSPGRGLYWQRRVGLKGKVFYIVKLRTMFIDAEKRGAAWCKGQDDPRVTPLGKTLRKFHLDELPQLWNVACGHMCLIGPRPERPEITKSLEKLIPSYQLRHGIKPGITGLSQVNLEPDLNINSTRMKQVLDLRYVKNANFWLDCKMLIATSLRMVGIKGQKAMEWTGLHQVISDIELRQVGYQFDTPESELWNPSMGPYNPNLKPNKSDAA